MPTKPTPVLKERSKGDSRLNAKPNVILNADTVLRSVCHLVYGDTPLFTVKEIEAITGRHERTVYYMLEGGKPIRVEDFIILARESAERGDFSLAEMCIPDMHTILPINDRSYETSFDEELGALVENIGRVREYMAVKKFRQAHRQFAKAKIELARMEQSLKELGE